MCFNIQSSVDICPTLCPFKSAPPLHPPNPSRIHLTHAVFWLVECSGALASYWSRDALCWSPCLGGKKGGIKEKDLWCKAHCKAGECCSAVLQHFSTEFQDNFCFTNKDVWGCRYAPTYCVCCVKHCKLCLKVPWVALSCLSGVSCI